MENKLSVLSANFNYMLSSPSLPGAISTLWVKPIHKIFFLLPGVERISIILFDKLCLRVTISCL